MCKEHMQQAAAYNARVNFSVEKVGTLHGSLSLWEKQDKMETTLDIHCNQEKENDKVAPPRIN